MKQAFAIILLACMALAAGAQVPLHMDIETSEARTRYLDVFRGESVALELAFKSYGKSLTFTDGTPATIFWQTNGMAAAWWTAPATTTTNGLVSAAWTPAMDCGAASYALFIGVGETSRMYRASFQVRLRGAPGYPTNPLPMPVEVIDFAAVSWTNAPWALPYAAGDNIVITNGVISSTVSGGGGGVAEESDPIFSEWVGDSTSTFVGSAYHASKADFATDAHWALYCDAADKLAEAALFADSSGYVTNRSSVTVNNFDVGTILHVGGGMMFYLPGGGSGIDDYTWADEVARKGDLSGFLSFEVDPIFTAWKPKREYHADSWTNIVWKNVYSNGWVFLVPYSNNLGDAE